MGTLCTASICRTLTRLQAESLVHHQAPSQRTWYCTSSFRDYVCSRTRVYAQAVPYCWMLFVVPMHLLTHELLLFATGIWTANIHDNLDGRSAAPWVSPWCSGFIMWGYLVLMSLLAKQSAGRKGCNMHRTQDLLLYGHKSLSPSSVAA